MGSFIYLTQHLGDGVPSERCPPIVLRAKDVSMVTTRYDTDGKSLGGSTVAVVGKTDPIRVHEDIDAIMRMFSAALEHDRISASHLDVSMQTPSPKLKRLSIAKLTADHIEGSVGGSSYKDLKTIKLRNDQWLLIVAALREKDQRDAEA